jgi:hypothetical protein
MKKPLLPLCLLLAAVPSFAQSTFQSFTPRYEADGTAYANAEVVRVKADGTMTLRSESGDLELTTDSHAVSGLAGLRRGGKVLIGYDTLTDDNGRTRRIVTYARQTSPTSGEPGPSVATASPASTASTVPVNRARVRALGGPTTTTVRQAGLSGPGLPFVGGLAVATGVGATSPYARTVPSIPLPTPAFNTVLPPAIAQAPQSDDEVGAFREDGERDFAAAAVVLAAHANEIDWQWSGFVNACLGGFTPVASPGRQWFLLLDGRMPTPTDDGCRSLSTSLLGMAKGWEQQLDIALAAARRADVLPGRTREILERHRIDR